MKWKAILRFGMPRDCRFATYKDDEIAAVIRLLTLGSQPITTAFCFDTDL
jgi:hypothetical protein